MIIDAEPGLRQREPIIHPTRVGVRRLRSTLRTYAPLFDAERAAALEEELVWWAGLLGVVRDLDILGARLRATAGRTARRSWWSDRSRGRSRPRSRCSTRPAGRRCTRALDSDRYRALVAELRRWRSDTPFTEKADVPGRQGEEVREQGQHEARQAAGAGHGRLRSSGDDDEADEFFHSARKAGKRARYAVELAAAAVGQQGRQDHLRPQGPAGRARRAPGQHRQRHVPAQQGVRMGIRSGHNGFTYGLLYARELARRDGRR